MEAEFEETLERKNEEFEEKLVELKNKLTDHENTVCRIYKINSN